MNKSSALFQIRALLSRSRLLRRPALITATALAIASLGHAQQPPLVYEVENTGAHFPKPAFPAYSHLPAITHLPDPFTFFSGTPRDSSFASWERRRNEIKASIEKYEIGPKPGTSDLSITAAYTPGSPGTLTVNILRLSNGRTLRLTSTINLPSGTPPAGGWPAIIRMALVPGVGASSLGIATIDYVHDDVTQYAAGQQISHAADPYFLMYPEYNAGPCPPAPAPCGAQVGQYSAWSWGVSRLIDGMEIASRQVVNPLPINLKRLGVSGCSYAGKMALFAGAFDERIAATFAQESGGGGAPAWRVSHGIEPDGTVEKTNNTDGSWFISGMKTDFRGDLVYKLPHDHHLLMAMVAPRALLVTGNTDFTWLSNRATYVTALATQNIYETFGIGGRFGFYIDGGHGHCAIPASQQPAIDNFWRKFLLGQDIPWNIRVFPQTAAYTGINTASWMPWATSGGGNQAPVVNLGPDATVEEGSAFARAGTFTDAGSSWSATVDYGDGSGAQSLALNPDQSFSLNHTYGDDGSYPLTVTVTDSEGAVGSDVALVTVTNGTPVVDRPLISPEPSFKGQGVIAGAGFQDPGVNDAPFAITVNYGDGSGAQPGEVSGQIGVGPEHAYSEVGTYTVTVTVTDKDGATGTNSVSHDVIYEFAGFFNPVRNAPVVNVMAAGRGIPVKFSLGGYQGAGIFAAGYPQSQQVSCDLGLPMFEVEQTTAVDSSSLTYDTGAGQYTYMWKTDKAWAGTCRVFTVKFNDGRVVRANFKFN